MQKKGYVPIGISISVMRPSALIQLLTKKEWRRLAVPLHNQSFGRMLFSGNSIHGFLKSPRLFGTNRFNFRIDKEKDDAGNDDWDNHNPVHSAVTEIRNQYAGNGGPN